MFLQKSNIEAIKDQRATKIKAIPAASKGDKPSELVIFVMYFWEFRRPIKY